jgi:hypothetical protein
MANRNEFLGLSSEMGCQVGSSCEGASYVGEWWIEDGYFNLKSVVSWVGDRDMN